MERKAPQTSQTRSFWFTSVLVKAPTTLASGFCPGATIATADDSRSIFACDKGSDHLPKEIQQSEPRVTAAEWNQSFNREKEAKSTFFSALKREKGKEDKNEEQWLTIIRNQYTEWKINRMARITKRPGHFLKLWSLNTKIPFYQQFQWTSF